MRPFNYSNLSEQKWDSDILGYIAAIYKEAGKQELYLKQRPEELEKLVSENKAESVITSVERALMSYPEITVTKPQANRFHNGGALDYERLHLKVL